MLKAKSRTVCVMGSTGSIGGNALEVLRGQSESFAVSGLAAGTNVKLLRSQVRRYRPKAVYISGDREARDLRREFGRKVQVFSRAEGLSAFAACADADILLAATSGTEGLLPVLEALRRGKRVALANKEVLVSAGHLVMAELRKHPRASLIPVDSEHSAIFQCLSGAAAGSLSRILLTGSGGPLRNVSRSRFSSLTKEEVIRHPKWNMGKKISVDSATLMNKGLEVIEASRLFDVPVAKVDVLIHPEAIVHSMVEMKDGSVLAQMGVPDMRLPIQYALSYPERLGRLSWERVDLTALSGLTFFPPDLKKFPCLEMAYHAGRIGGSLPGALIAADEVAVEAFLEGRIRFDRIPAVIGKVLAAHRTVKDPDLAAVRRVHDESAEKAREYCGACS